MHRPWCSTSCSLCCCQLRRPWLVRRQRWDWSRRRPCTLNRDLWPVAKTLGKPAVENDFGVVKRGNTDSQDELCQSVKRQIWKSLLCTLPPSTLPFSRMSHHKGLSVFFSQTYPHNTPNERERHNSRGTRGQFKSQRSVNTSLTLWQTGMVWLTPQQQPHISYLDDPWLLPCLGMDIWPPYTFSSHTSHPCTYFGGVLFPLWRSMSGLGVSSLINNTKCKLQQAKIILKRSNRNSYMTEWLHLVASMWQYVICMRP